MTLFQKWWDNNTKQLSIRWEYSSWSKNGTGMIWRFRTNGAKKSNPEDTCLDVFLELGYLVINYTNFNLQKNSRKGL